MWELVKRILAKFANAKKEKANFRKIYQELTNQEIEDLRTFYHLNDEKIFEEICNFHNLNS